MSARTGVENSRSGPHLTDRQLQVLRVYAVTGSYKETGRELGVSPQTIKNHLTIVRARLGVETTIQAAMAVFGTE